MRLDVDGDAATALDAAATLAEEALAESGVDRSRVVGAGMGLPGPIDRRTGEISSSVILPGWRGLRPGHELARRLNSPSRSTTTPTSARSARSRSAPAGASRTSSTSRSPRASAAGSSSTAGSTTERPGSPASSGTCPSARDGAVCSCGNRGCLQTVAAAGPIGAALRAAHGPDLTVAGSAELVAAGDVPGRVVNDAGRVIGRVLADLCNHLNPAAIIVGGELSTAGSPLLAGIREAVDRYALPGAAQAAEIREGVLGERAELLGALALVIADTERLRSAGFASLHEPLGARAGLALGHDRGRRLEGGRGRRSSRIFQIGKSERRSVA